MKISPRTKTVLKRAATSVLRAGGRYVRRRMTSYIKSKMKKTPRAVKRLEASKLPTLNYSRDSTPAGPGATLNLGVATVSAFQWPSQGDRGNRAFVYINDLCVDRTFYYTGAAQSALDIGPIKVRWCLFQMKAFPGQPTGQLVQALQNLKPEFFTERLSNAKSFRTFNDTTAGSAVWDSAYNKLEVNRDNHILLATCSKVIHPRSPQSQTKKGDDSMWRLKRTFKFKKALNYSTVSNAEPDDCIYEVFWCYPVSPILYPSANPVANAYVQYNRQHCITFKETGSM